MNKKVEFLHGTVEVRTHKNKNSWRNEDQISESLDVLLRFKTEHCNDHVFASTYEGSFRPEEVHTQVAAFNELADAIEKARRKLNRVWTARCVQAGYVFDNEGKLEDRV